MFTSQTYDLLIIHLLPPRILGPALMGLAAESQHFKLGYDSLLRKALQPTMVRTAYPLSLRELRGLTSVMHSLVSLVPWASRDHRGS